LGKVELELGELNHAAEILCRSLEVARNGQAGFEINMTLHSLGDAELLRSDAAAAGACHRESLSGSVVPGNALHCLPLRIGTA
jgi:hypothetical protein